MDRAPEIHVTYLSLSLFFFLIFIVIQLQLCAFSPHPPTPPQLNPPPSPTSTLPLDFVHVSFIVVPVLSLFYSCKISQLRLQKFSRACYFNNKKKQCIECPNFYCLLMDYYPFINIETEKHH